MLKYVNKHDILNAEPGSASCPIAQSLRRQLNLPKNARLSVGTDYVYVRTPNKGGNAWTVGKMFKLGAAAKALVKAFDYGDFETRRALKPRHIRIYPV